MKKQFFISLAMLAVIPVCLQAAAAQSVPAERTVQPANEKTRSPTVGAGPSQETGFKEVSKEKFKEIYFRLGGGKKTGWTEEYWKKSFENDLRTGWKFKVELPRTPDHTRMYIVSDAKAKEHRLFFLLDEEEDSSDFPAA